MTIKVETGKPPRHMGKHKEFLATIRDLEVNQFFNYELSSYERQCLSVAQILLNRRYRTEPISKESAIRKIWRIK
jgi:hypothetical protein